MLLFTLYIRLIRYTTLFLRFNQPGTTMSPSSRFILYLSLDGQHSWNSLQVRRMKLLQLPPSPNGQVCSKWWPCHHLWSALSFPCIQMSPMEFARCFTGGTSFKTNTCHDTSALWPGVLASITSQVFHFTQTILSLSVVGFPTSTHSMHFLCHVPHLQCLSPHMIISNQVALLLLATLSGLIQVHFIFTSNLLVAFPVNLHLHPFQIPVHLQDLQWFLLQSSFHKPCMAQLPLSLQAPSPLSFLCHVPHIQCLSPHLIISNQVILPYQSMFPCHSIHQMKAMLHSLSQDIIPRTLP